MNLLKLLPDVIPGDHARQIHVQDALRDHLRATSGRVEILDLGCGDGRALDIVGDFPGAAYNGIDISDSPEVRSRTRADATFGVFDGINIPFPDDHFDCVYSCSVFEHVRHPDALMKDVHRALKPGGTMLGSVSYLEPYHSYSIFNHTPYGIYTVLKDAGLRPIWLRPGIDGFTIIVRALSRRRRWFDRWFHTESPINRLVAARSRLKRSHSIARENAAKLAFAGQIIFAAVKD